jgi:hypothetical protein
MSHRPNTTGLLVGLLLLAACGRDTQSGTAPTRSAQAGAPMNDSVSRYHVVASTYDAKAAVLSVRLAAGVYQYAAVPAAVAAGLVTASDRDAYFLQKINGKFAETHLPAGSPEIPRLGL